MEFSSVWVLVTQDLLIQKQFVFESFEKRLSISFTRTQMRRDPLLKTKKKYTCYTSCIEFDISNGMG